MNRIDAIKYLALIALGMMAVPAFAATTINLRACARTATIGAASIAIWGYDQGAPGSPCAATVPGPTLTVPPGETTLTINLTNSLPRPTSIVIPGLTAQLNPVRSADSQGRQRVRAFTTEAAQNGGAATYTWTGLKPGTYLYHSGSHPAVQVQMGLYGALKMDAGTKTAYSGVPYTNEVVLLYSEIDPVLHAAVAAGAYATRGVADYKPTYFLVNGQPYPAGQPTINVGNPNDTVLIRFLNAGLRPHVPTLQGGYMNLIAEDGNRYPYRQIQYSANLPPLKTLDAVWVPAALGTYPLYDRSLHLTTNGNLGGGMLTYLSVGGVATLVAVDDAFVVGQGKTLSIAPPGVLANDTVTAGSTAVQVTGASQGTASLLSDGSFTYQPIPTFSGSDLFTYKVTNGPAASNVATVRISVAPNNPPVAQNDAVTTAQNTPVTINVLANDSDADGDTLTVTNLTQPATGTGSVSLSGQNVNYTPPNATFTGTATFTYTAFDGLAASNTATVTVSVGAPPNTPPVAVDDAAQTTQNVAVTINLVANDYDPDGTINPATVATVDNPTMGGTVANQGNGTVIFTPKRNFRGTDVFTYTVRDNLGAVSNKATVRVNVVR